MRGPSFPPPKCSATLYLETIAYVVLTSFPEGRHLSLSLSPLVGIAPPHVVNSLVCTVSRWDKGLSHRGSTHKEQRTEDCENGKSLNACFCPFFFFCLEREGIFVFRVFVCLLPKRTFPYICHAIKVSEQTTKVQEPLIVNPGASPIHTSAPRAFPCQISLFPIPCSICLLPIES